MLQIIHDDHLRLDELFTCIAADDAWVRMRAIDTFEKIVKDRPELAQSYLPSIFTNLTKSDQPSIQWHLAQIFSEIELTDDQRNQAISWLKAKIGITDVDWIVSVNVMKALRYFHENGYVATSDLQRLFTVQQAHKSKSVRKKATDFLANL